MLQKFKQYLIPHLIGLALMVTGWFVPIINVGMTNFTANKEIFSTTNVFSLVLILIGAYLPDVWISFLKRKEKSQ